MNLIDIFQKYKYYSILTKEEAARFQLIIDYFYEDDVIPKDLKGLYLSKNQDELFLVIDGRDKDITELCQKWDKKISSFIAFGTEDREVIKKLKYNVVQIVLYSSGETVDQSEEGSLNISRKILLSCDSITDEIISISEDEAVEIPFYIVPVEGFQLNSQIISELKEKVPNSELNELKFLYSTIKKKYKGPVEGNKCIKSFTEDQYIKVKEWLNSNENQDNSNR